MELEELSLACAADELRGRRLHGAKLRPLRGKKTSSLASDSVVQGSNGIKTLLDSARALHLRRDAAS
jgi:hypothetical protein